MVEHSGHMVPEGGYDMIPKYVFDGCLLAGETAGLCMNMGYQVRGMDFAVASGQMAAKAAVEALDTVNVDEALSVNKYEVDEETPHIVLAEDFSLMTPVWRARCGRLRTCGRPLFCICHACWLCRQITGIEVVVDLLNTAAQYVVGITRFG